MAGRADRTVRPLKVLHVLDNLGMGGAETWLMALLKHWREQGPDARPVEILATDRAHADLAKTVTS